MAGKYFLFAYLSICIINFDLCLGFHDNMKITPSKNQNEHLKFKTRTLFLNIFSQMSNQNYFSLFPTAWCDWGAF